VKANVSVCSPPLHTTICAGDTRTFRIGVADHLVGDKPGGGIFAAAWRMRSEAEASPEGIVFRDDHDLVAVDFIGGDGAEGSIPCLEDDDRNHERCEAAKA
jgi:hypothetical protein